MRDHGSSGLFSSEMDVCLNGFVADEVFNGGMDMHMQLPNNLLAGAEKPFQTF